MRVESLSSIHIADRYSIQLRCVSPASSIHWEQDRPCYATANEAKQYNDSEEPQETISIQRVVAENESVVESFKAVEPVVASATGKGCSISETLLMMN